MSPALRIIAWRKPPQTRAKTLASEIAIREIGAEGNHESNILSKCVFAKSELQSPR
jgi:hypothetical protein